MALAPDLSTSSTSDLQTVNVVSFSNNNVAQLWIDALRKNGAEMLEDSAVQSLQDITRQKLAVILDQDIPDECIETIISKYESLYLSDATRSLRFFVCIWDKTISNETDRLRIVDITNMAPNAFPARVNRALFKSRLPAFLRKYYEVDIADTLEEINGIQYRPITIQGYKKTWEIKILEYITEWLYIHDKWLYSYHPATQKMREIQENERVFVTKNGSRISAQMIDLVNLKDETEEE